jgi:hypothetical protein
LPINIVTPIPYAKFLDDNRMAIYGKVVVNYAIRDAKATP